MTARSASAAAAPTSIVIGIRFDGRVLLELLADDYSLLEVADTRVDAQDELIATIVRWATGEIGPARPRGAARSAVDTDYRLAYTVQVTSPASPALHRFTDRANGLAGRFARVFAAREADDRGDAGRRDAERLADDLAWEIRRFLRLSRERAAMRLAHGAYVGILQRYAEDLRGITAEEDQSAYDGLQDTIGRIVEDEAYLRLAEDEAARTAYAEIVDQLADLYQWRMQLAKGGISLPRH